MISTIDNMHVDKRLFAVAQAMAEQLNKNVEYVNKGSINASSGLVPSQLMVFLKIDGEMFTVALKGDTFMDIISKHTTEGLARDFTNQVHRQTLFDAD